MNAPQQNRCLNTIDLFEQPADEKKASQNDHNTANSIAPSHVEAEKYGRGYAGRAIAAGYSDFQIFAYTDSTGKALYWKARASNPGYFELPEAEAKILATSVGAKKNKWIKPFHWTGGGFQKGEPKHPDSGKPLYNLHHIAQADPAAVVWITEGEQKADALASLGFIATTTGGSSSVNSSDWQPLAGRTVVIWPDHDAPGQKYATAIKEVLTPLGCAVSVLDVESIDVNGQPLPPKGDAMDWLHLRQAAELTTSAADMEALPRVEPVPAPQAEPEPIDEQAVLIRLAALTPLDYDRQRGEAARTLGIRPATLDKAVKGLQAEQAEAETSTGFFEPVEPWHEPVNGLELLDELTAVVHRHIVCRDSTAQAAALWVAFTWCIEVAQVAPIACITAPEKRCGKTQFLTLIGKVCRDPMPASSITAAALFRSIELWKPTLLIDEADAFMKDNEDLRGLLNAGHSRDNAYAIRTTGDDHTPTRFNVWGAKALSGIGHLPDTLRDRSVLLELRRKEPHEHRQRLRHADPAQWQRLKQQFCRWSMDNLTALSQARPELPEALNDRAQDNWEILLAIADSAGGHWPVTARKAAININGAEQHSPSVNEELLSDIRAIFERTRSTRITSAQLVDYLIEDEEGPWAAWNRGRPITPRQLATRLGEFGVKARQLRIGTVNNRGYEKEQFRDAFSRYLPKEGVLSATTLQPLQDKAFSDFQSATADSSVADEKTLKPLRGKDCSTVALENTHSRSDAQNVANVAPDSIGSIPL